MDQGDLKNLRELVEFLKASGIAEFDMEQPDIKVRLKFESGTPSTGAGMSATDLAAFAQMLRPTTVMAAPMPAAMMPLEAAGTPVQAATEAGSAAAGAAEVDEDAGLHIVKSPLVGTFYDASSPGAEPFIKVGDTVDSGKVLCIVEAMKIMNEIESDAAGQVVKVYAKAGQPVEYGQKLFGIRA